MKEIKSNVLHEVAVRVLEGDARIVAASKLALMKVHSLNVALTSTGDQYFKEHVQEMVVNSLLTETDSRDILESLQYHHQSTLN